MDRIVFRLFSKNHNTVVGARGHSKASPQSRLYRTMPNMPTSAIAQLHEPPCMYLQLKAIIEPPNVDPTSDATQSRLSSSAYRGLDILGNSQERTIRSAAHGSPKNQGNVLVTRTRVQTARDHSESFQSVDAVNSDNDVAASSCTQPPSSRDNRYCPWRTMPPLPSYTSVAFPHTDNNNY